jgi:hypothetical protein
MTASTCFLLLFNVLEGLSCNESGANHPPSLIDLSRLDKNSSGRMGQQTDVLRCHLLSNLWRICHVYECPHMLCAIFSTEFPLLRKI